jgi:predicted MFS family arabinose efflux permease
MPAKIDRPKITATMAEPSGHSSTYIIALLAFIMFVTVTSEFVVMGMLPMMALDLNISLARAGNFVTWFALPASIFGPVLSLIAARYSSRNFLLTAVLIFTLANFIIALVQQYYIIVAMRIVQGALLPAIASIIVVEAVQRVTAKQRGSAISNVNLGIVMTTILGVPGSAMLANALGWSASFVALAVLGLMSTVMLLMMIAPTHQVAAQQARALTDVTWLLRGPFLRHLLLSALIFAGMFTSYTYIAALLTEVTDSQHSIIGWLLMVFGISGIAGNILAGRIVDADPLTATAAVALLLAIAMMAIVPMAANAFFLALLIVLWGGAHMAAFVINQVRVMQAAQHAQTLALSLNISACNLGIALGAMFGGYITERVSIEFVGYAGALILTIALVMAKAMLIYNITPAALVEKATRT